MSAAGIQERFIHEITQRGTDDHYIDRDEEREILQIALQLGFTADSARAALAQVCADNGYVLESGIYKQIRERVEAHAVGAIDRRQFERLFAQARQTIAGKATDRQVKVMIVQALEDTGQTRIKTGWFGNWYTRLKRELGMG
jgi:hypothetical protein